MERILARIRGYNILPYLWVYHLLGIVGLILPQTRDLFLNLVPLHVILIFLLLLIFHGPFKNGFLWKAGLIFLIGLFMGILGAKTGLIFGDYYYGDTLGPGVFGTPLLIGAIWLLLVYSSLTVTSTQMDVPYFRIFLAAAMMVVFDIVLEPSANALEMWTRDGPLPLQNYIAWFIIAFFMLFFAERVSLVNKENKIAQPLFFIQLGSLIVINLWFYII